MKQINFHDLTCAFETKMSRAYNKKIKEAMKQLDQEFATYFLEEWRKAKMDEKIRKSAKTDPVIQEMLDEQGVEYINETYDAILESCKEWEDE